MGILNKNKSADIKASIDYGCQTREIDLSHIEMSNVCMDSLIQIELLSNISFIEPPIPNPNDGSFDLKFGIKENSDVNISLYDVIGNKVAELINRNFKKVFISILLMFRCCLQECIYLFILMVLIQLLSI